MADSILAEGIKFERKHEKAPQWVKGKVSVRVSKFIEFLKKYEENDFVNLDLLESKNKVVYFKLNTWKPTPKTEVGEKPEYPTEPNPDDIPF